MSFNELDTGTSSIELSDGTVIKATSIYGSTNIYVSSPRRELLAGAIREIVYKIQAKATTMERFEFQGEYYVTSNPLTLGMAGTPTKGTGPEIEGKPIGDGGFSFEPINGYIQEIAVRNLTQVRYKDDDVGIVSLFMYDHASLSGDLVTKVNVLGNDSIPHLQVTVGREHIRDISANFSEDFQKLYIATARQPPGEIVIVSYEKYEIQYSEGVERDVWMLVERASLIYEPEGYYWINTVVDRNGQIGCWRTIAVPEQVAESYRETYNNPVGSPPTGINYGPWEAELLSGLHNGYSILFYDIDLGSYVDGVVTDSFTVAKDLNGKECDYQVIYENADAFDNNWGGSDHTGSWDIYIKEEARSESSYYSGYLLYPSSNHNTSSRVAMSGGYAEYYFGEFSYTLFSGSHSSCLNSEEYENYPPDSEGLPGGYSMSTTFHNETIEGVISPAQRTRSNISILSDYGKLTIDAVESQSDTVGAVNHIYMFNPLQYCGYPIGSVGALPPEASYELEYVNQMDIIYPFEEKDIYSVENSFISCDNESGMIFYGARIAKLIGETATWRIFCEYENEIFNITDLVTVAFGEKLVSGWDELIGFDYMTGFEAILFATASGEEIINEEEEEE